MEMTPEVVKQICKDTKGYGTAYLNDVLYLHHKVRQRPGSTEFCPCRAPAHEPDCAPCCSQGFREIKNLEPYTGLKVRQRETAAQGSNAQLRGNGPPPLAMSVLRWALAGLVA